MAQPDLPLRPHSGVTASNIYINFAKYTGHKSFESKKDIPVERNDYSANFNIVAKSLNSGFVSMNRTTSRNLMPSGRPSEVPNLIQTKSPNGEAVDPIRAMSGYNSLGHT